MLSIEFEVLWRSFGPGFKLVSKRLDLCIVLEVHFGRKGIGYLDVRERPINLNYVLSSY